MGCVSKKGPTWLDKVRFIKTFAMSKCTTPWRVYLQTGGKAAGNLAMSMLYVDTGDLVRSFFRPKGTRSRYHSIPGLGRGKRRIKKGLFPEPSDLIADTVRSATGLKKPTYSDGFNHIWDVDTHLQKVLNKVVFFNMANDFGYDWFSGIMLDPGSSCNNGRVKATYENGNWDEGGWRPMVKLGDPAFAVGCFCGDNQIILDEGTWVISVYNRLTPLSGSPGSTGSWLLFVGPVEKLAPCGQPITLTTPADGFDEDEKFSVVKAPAIIRVLARSPGFDGGHELGPFDPITIQGFRMY